MALTNEGELLLLAEEKSRMIPNTIMENLLKT